jgi:thioredoxin 2
MQTHSSAPSSSAAANASSVIVACPNCHTRVRVPSAKLTDDPVCANCKSHVLSGKTFALDEAAFTTHVDKASFPVLVDFWAPWCGPCRMMAPTLDRLAQLESSRIQVAKVNTDEQQALAGRFNIRSIPTLILFRDGKELARQSGAVDASSLARWLDNALAQ